MAARRLYTGMMDRKGATGDDRAVRKVIESWYRAMEAGDVPVLLSLVTRDVIVKPPGSSPIEGEKALQQALSAFLRIHTETVDYELEEVEISGRLAFARISESATILPRSGEEAISMSGMHLTILRRQPDGEWLIARDISSRVSAT
jgi:uncharacterized protein (TIGR02246 family)